MRRLLTKTFRFTCSKFEEILAVIRPFLVHDLVFGTRTKLSANVRLRVTDDGTCVLGNNVMIGNNAELTASGGDILIGDNVFIGRGVTIVAVDGIRVGANTLIAENVTIRDHNHVFGQSRLIRDCGLTAKPIEIGENVWIGAKSCILSGVTIGRNSVIGAGSVVTKSMPENVVCAGVPARIIRNTLK